MAYRNFGQLNTQQVLENLPGWHLFPFNEESASDSISFMAGEDVGDSEIEWDINSLDCIIAAGDSVWKEMPHGITPMTLHFSTYLSDDIDTSVYYSALIDSAELVDVVMSSDGEIVGNVYLQKLPEDASFLTRDEDDEHYALAIITDSGMIGRGYFAFDQNSPVASRIIREYTSALEKLTAALILQPQFNATVSDFEAGQFNRSSLELILANKEDEMAKHVWFKPIAGLQDWVLFLPYTEDSVMINLYQKVTNSPIEIIEDSMYAVEDGALPWLDKSLRFLTRPSLDDIRFTSYSPILVSLERSAKRIDGLIHDEDNDVQQVVEMGGLEVTIRGGSDKEPTLHNDKDGFIFSHRYIAQCDAIDLLVSFEFIAHNETNVYERDIMVIFGNLIHALKEALV